MEGINTPDGRFKQIIGRMKRRGNDYWEFVTIKTDQVQARDGDGLNLYDDGSNGIEIADGGGISFAGTGRIDWTKITANSITETNITAQGGSDVTFLQTANDGSIYEAHESASNPGQSLIVDFVSVDAFNWVKILGTYSGSTSHALEIELYNWDTTSWDHFDAMQMGFDNSGTVMENHDFFVPDDADYIGTGGDAGKVRVRIEHPMNGIANHEWFFDVVALYQ